MKIKCRPEDFCVEEIAEPRHGGGDFALYRLEKKSIGTPEAVDAICRAWRVPRDEVGIGGLKDRHALTRQYLSIRNGPRRSLRQTNFELAYLGQTSRPFDSKDILANRFEIVLRDLQPLDIERLANLLPRIAESGIPNYFDEQRFGSVGASGDFIARPWCLGDYERALWLALAEANEHDRPDVGKEKAELRAHWEDWPTCRRNVVRPVTRGALDLLCRRPDDFRGAFVRIPQHERRMYLAAFQSFLWNRILSEFLRAAFDARELFEVEIARTRVAFFRDAPTDAVREQLARPLPLPSAREKSELGNLCELYERVAAEAGLQYRELRVKYPRDSFFSRGSRSAVFRPRSVTWEVGDDELAETSRTPASRKLLLRFDLPAGAYATIVVKRIAAEP